MYIERLAEQELERILVSGKVGIIVGARQVGKTTLVEHVLAGRRALFLNFDVDIDKQRFMAASVLSPHDGLASLGNPDVLVVDEVQRLPEAARIVKGWYDSRLPLRMLLLGSSSLNLLDQAAESLTGRNERLQLSPLVFEEALRSHEWYSDAYTPGILREQFAAPLRVSLMHSLAFGGYPEVVLAGDKPRLLRELSSDYLWKDILQTGLVKTPDLIKRLLTLLAHQVGNEVSTQELATQLQMARPTVERYLDLLEQTFVVFRLPSFSTNPRKEITRGKKVFFWDTGIRNALLNAFSTEEFRPDIGALWENWVIAEAAKHNLLRGAVSELFFWRSRAQSEVDLIVKTGDRVSAFEIKWRSRRPASRAFQAQYGVAVQPVSSENPLIGGQLEGKGEVRGKAEVEDEE
ncbi:MAG: ATP-binding protein [candidate division WOR-3 bacterium]|nr:ATP-binding protein [candidate division WOR-3 bacterium]